MGEKEKKDHLAAKAGRTSRKEKRGSPRAKKRLMVRYGVEAPDRTGFTKNLSETGLNIKTNAVIQPGTTIQLEVRAPEKTFSLWGRVVWAKRVPAQLAHILDCGMGIQFIDPGPDWVEFCRRRLFQR